MKLFVSNADDDSSQLGDKLFFYKIVKFSSWMHPGNRPGSGRIFCGNLYGLCLLDELFSMEAKYFLSRDFLVRASRHLEVLGVLVSLGGSD